MTRRISERRLCLYALASVVALALAACSSGGGATSKRQAGGSTSTAPTAPSYVAAPAPAGAFTLASDALRGDGKYPRGLTCEGGNSPPPLAWDNVPEGAVELVLLMEDPGAPNGTFTHWVAWGIPARAGLLDRSRHPRGMVEGKNDFGNTGYGGPCPGQGSGRHTYVFTLTAVGGRIPLGAGATGAEVRTALAALPIRGTATVNSYYEFGLDNPVPGETRNGAPGPP